MKQATCIITCANCDGVFRAFRFLPGFRDGDDWPKAVVYNDIFEACRQAIDWLSQYGRSTQLILSPEAEQAFNGVPQHDTGWREASCALRRSQ